MHQSHQSARIPASTSTFKNLRAFFSRHVWRHLLTCSVFWAVAAVFLNALRLSSLKQYGFSRTIYRYASLGGRREDEQQFHLDQQAKPELPLIHHSETKGQNFTLQRMDPIQLARQVLLDVDRLPLRGNLTRFTKLLTQFFDASSSRTGAHISLNFSSQGVTDLVLRIGFAEVPPYDVGYERAADSLAETMNLNIFGREGYVFKRRPGKRLNPYDVVNPASMDPFRHTNLANVPSLCPAGRKALPPWLIELRNVWMGASGEIYVPERAVRRAGSTEWIVREYLYQDGCCGNDGCCEKDWKLAKGKHTSFRLPHGQPRRAKIGFSLSQYHGATYFHVLNYAIPRLLMFWHVALAVMAVPGGKIVGPGEPRVMRELLRSYGVPDAKMLLFERKRKAPIFFERLFVPGPFQLDAYRYECVVRTVARVIAAQSLSSGYSTPQNATAPLVVLLDRARGRSADGTRCYGHRCMKNFGALRSAIRAEFGNRIRLEVLSGRDPDVLNSAIRLFSRATVVVGVHDASFANIIFMRGKGTYCIHLGWEGMWKLYARIAKKFGVDFVHLVTLRASQNGENALADIPVVVLAIRNALEREGVRLERPRMRRIAWRLEAVSMRLGDGGGASGVTKGANASVTNDTDRNAFAEDGQEFLPHLGTASRSKQRKRLNWAYPSSCSSSSPSLFTSRLDSLLASNSTLTLLAAFDRLLHDYITWHARVSAQLEPCVKVLSWSCDPSAGLGDRMRGLLHALMLAMETRRYLVVRTPPGMFPLKTFLQPHRIAWDTLLRGKGGRPVLNSTFTYFWGKLMDDRSINFVHGPGGFEATYGHVAHVSVVSRAFPHYERLVGSKWFIRNCEESPEDGVHRESRCGMSGSENIALNRLLHRALFRFTQKSTTRARAIAAEHGLRDYIAVHARIGGSLDPHHGRFSAFYANLNATAAHLLACVRVRRERLSLPKLPLFLASDDQRFKGILARQALEQGLRVVVSPIVPRHSKVRVRGRVNEKRVASTLADTVTETMLLSGGRLIATTGSGMSTYAAIVGEGFLRNCTAFNSASIL